MQLTKYVILNLDFFNSRKIYKNVSFINSRKRIKVTITLIEWTRTNRIYVGCSIVHKVCLYLCYKQILVFYSWTLKHDALVHLLQELQFTLLWFIIFITNNFAFKSNRKEPLNIIKHLENLYLYIEWEFFYLL